MTRGTSLHAAAAPVLIATTRADLNQQQLTRVVAELFDTDDLEALRDINFRVTDLAGLTLGLATADTVYIDTNAAGHGWFVDRSVDDDREFSFADGARVMSAKLGSVASGRMDLVTVPRHEVGHLLGLEHDDGDETRLMSETLEAGTRLGENDSARASVGDRSSLHARYASWNLNHDRWLRASIWRSDDGEPAKPTRTTSNEGSSHDLVPVIEAWWFERRD